MFGRLALLSLLLHIASANFSPDFSLWLQNYYGPQIRDQLERRDLGPQGSFGGKASNGEKIKNQAVVFVHGVSDTAGEKMRQAADWYKEHAGYSENEVYSTTYFNGAQGNPLKWTEYSMRCEYIKQVRAMMVAVRLYTGKSIDVVAFSLGVAVSRKAILGGRCVDTGENLGGPLTRIIDTYVGVAGPNHGITWQLGGVSLPGCALSLIPICNAVTGLYSGNCPNESEYLQDINAGSNYEGRHVYTIYSKADQIVGYQVCNRLTSQIVNQDGEKIYDNLKHDEVFHNTHDVQVAMIKDHIVI